MDMSLIILKYLVECLKALCLGLSFFSYRYINDLPNVSKFLSFYLFADDTNIYFDASDTIKLQKDYESGTSTCQKMAWGKYISSKCRKNQFCDFLFPCQKDHWTDYNQIWLETRF